jgi:hypothetical protein
MPDDPNLRSTGRSPKDDSKYNSTAARDGGSSHQGSDGDYSPRYLGRQQQQK